MRPGQAKPETHIFNHSPIFRFGEGNGTPLQYSCLENPMDGGAWKAAVHGVAKVRHDLVTSLSLFTFMHWRRQWHPLQWSCLEDPRDRGAWWAAVYGVAQSPTQLSDLAAAVAAAQKPPNSERSHQRDVNHGLLSHPAQTANEVHLTKFLY